MKLQVPTGKIEMNVKARRQVFRRLVEALIFEGVLEASSIALYKENESKVDSYVIEGRDWAGNRVMYSFEGWRAYSFGMIRMGDSPMFRNCFKASGPESGEADSVALFLEETVAVNRPSLTVLSSFMVELEETIRKQAQWMQERVLHQEGERKLLGRSLAELESISTEGHPYHPCYKSRIGFTPEHNRSYGPEYQPDVRLDWLAAAYEEVIWNAGDEGDWRYVIESELATEDRSRFCEQLASLGLSADDYAFLPVHPWQWGYLQEKHPDLLANCRIVPLGHGSEFYRPQQSIRTLSCASGASRGDVKLSLGIVNTSSMRHLTVHSTVAAPAVSAWLQKIADSDPYLQESGLILLHEYAGITLSAANGAIGAIWRENVEKYLQPGEEAVPFFTLAATEVDGTAFIAPWIAWYGMESWFRQLLRRSVIPVVHLLVAHGIVMESHGQNMVLVHRNGMPERVALRDFHEGVEYYGPFLTSPELVPDFARLHSAYAEGEPGDYFEMGSLQDLSEMLMDALWFMNIGTIITFAASRFPIGERELWAIVAEELDSYRASFPALQERFDLLRIFAPEYVIEPLVQRRMFGGTKIAPRPAPNPLSLVRQPDDQTQRENSSCSQ
ncbi:siderophore biosynthesis protein [Paenibacillus sp. 1011MAR3C5]|uniref:IucA/IucC family protein n=1 Tax=Paenibacillus sp. 1011MAR3C5 TaxID=1675787 RepID=UPI000E6D345E|nr:IucA/IucC family protein [Paenibacillus sp. 1011MAR3C5]RJE87515.1 siderophore biosynthesis protein [Paenibacillus sp. 1011MAR3C5]